MLKLYVLREKNIFFYLINPIHRGGKIFHDRSNSCSFLVTLDILCNMCAILDARTQSSLPRIFFCPTDSIISNETIHYILYIYYMKKLTSACKSDDAKQQIQIYIYITRARGRGTSGETLLHLRWCVTNAIHLKKYLHPVFAREHRDLEEISGTISRLFFFPRVIYRRML